MSFVPLTARAAGLWAALALLAGMPAAAHAQVRASAHALLDVPFVSQTPELCGGAAVAMVLRYWGERQVFPQDFESLVVASERGIPTGALAAAVRARQWQAVLISADDRDAHARIRDVIDRGQPLIALIEVGPRTFHYVVIVGATDQEVVVHDPARAPFRVLRWESFDKAFDAAGRWAMVVLPPASGAVNRTGSEQPASLPAAEAKPAAPCDGLIDRGITLAVEGDAEAAEGSLIAATHLCPLSSAAWRELAGLRFSQSRWADAASLASTAVRLDPADAHARELLATSRFLSGDVLGALDAWTPLGQPRIDAVNILGAERTRQPVVVEATGLQPRQLLTSEALSRAERRVRALPVAADAHVRFEPIDDGLAKVDVALSERDPYPKGWVTLGVLAGRAAVGRGATVAEAGLLGEGERLTVMGRWREERPRVALTFAFPAPSLLPGVVSFDGVWEKQSYADARETRRRFGIQLDHWSRSWLRWTSGVAVDRFDSRRFVSVEAGVDVRAARDRVAFAINANQWIPTSSDDAFGTVTWLAAWRSNTASHRAAWSALAEVTVAGDAAPRAVWAGAGTGSARAGLLRAHPLLDDNILTGPVFGRGVARSTIEYARPIWRPMGSTLSIAGFVDAAGAWRRAGDAHASPLYVDAGVGIRVRTPGRAEGVRVDVAHGLHGGGVAVSLGVISSWPR